MKCFEILKRMKTMKLISIRMALFGLCFCFLIGGKAQVVEIENPQITIEDSLVNVAYRTVHQNNLSGAISILKPADYLDKNHTTYATDGAMALIGGSNLWGIGNALVLIDGVPRSMGDITTVEVDQISFLKGANAVVLYGSRAANGVILVTSKRGIVGERTSNVRINAGINVPKAFPVYLGSAEYMQYYNQASLNDGLKALYDSATISNYSSNSNRYRYPDVDYYSSDYLQKVSNYYNADVDFSGGNERAKFFAAAGFQNQNSLLKIGEGNNETITRLNIRANIDLKLNDFINTYVNVSTVFYDARTANGNYWQQSSTLHPHRYAPLIPTDLVEKGNEEAQTLLNNGRLIDGKFILGGTQEYLTNPIADAFSAGHQTYTSRQFQYSAGVNVDLGKVLSGLSFHSQVSIDYSNAYVQSVNNTYAVYIPVWKTYDGSDSISSLTKYNKDSNNGNQNLSGNWNEQIVDFNFHFDYKNTFNKVHNLYAMILASGYRGKQTGDFQNRTNSNLGLQLDYNYDNKYFADFSGAIVNSTKLPENTRVAFSPTLRLGWLISEEDFLKGSETIDRLKISASAGIINTDLDFNSYYMYDEVYSSTAYFSWHEGTWVSQATTISRGGNPNLDYVKRNELSFSVEGSFFKRSIDVLANVFVVEKNGLPVQAYNQYPSFFRTYWPETSFVPFANYEANLYKGADFQVYYNKKAGDFNLRLGVTGTYVATEALIREELFEDTYRNRAGKPISAMFGLQSDGLFMDQDAIDNHAIQKFGEVKPGDIKYKDQNNDGIIDERDEVMIGNWASPFYAGLNFTAQFKNFTLFVLGTSQFGGTGMKGGSNADDKKNTYYWVYGDRKYSEVVRDSWTEETKNTATYPRLTTLSGDNNFRSSDFWTYSTNAVNLAKIQLTYTFSEKSFKGAAIKGLNLYVSGSNLLTISENKDVMELNVGRTPQTRYYNFGIKAVF
jgi:TonB-linked SusC/RagA family outer membrane protein